VPLLAVTLALMLTAAPAAGSSPAAAPSAGPAGTCRSPSPLPSTSTIRLAYTLRPTVIQPVTSGVLDSARRIIGSRLASVIDGTEVIAEAPDRIVVTAPGTADAERIRRLAASTGQLEFLEVPAEFANALVDGGPLPVGMSRTQIFGGEDIVAVAPGVDATGALAVDLELTQHGVDLFNQYAVENLGNRFAIVLDGVVLTGPMVVTDHYDARAQIAGDFTTQEMDDLVAVLTFGPLPLGLVEVQPCDAPEG
jgi:preprotein translocase subunit SecD